MPLLLLYSVIVILLHLWVNFTHSTCVHLLYAKYKVCFFFFTFQMFYKMVDTQYDSKIHNLHFNNGGEYIWFFILSQHDILHQITYLGTPEQNGIVEWKNLHLLEITCALLFTMHVP